MHLLLAAAIAAAAVPQQQYLDEAAFAIESGRLDQARAMIEKAVADGAGGRSLDRLIADLAFASGDHQSAYGAYQQLLLEGSDARLAERAGIAALHLRRDEEAVALLRSATADPQGSWRAWNALGVAADRRGDWPEADRAYGEALMRNPRAPQIINNRGWSLLLRGQWAEASALIEQAAVLDPQSRRIADNLELARAALAEDLPRRRSGESEADWAARLNDAGVAARIRGDRKRALAAFARAIEARSQWFERAANNLSSLEAGQ